MSEQFEQLKSNKSSLKALIQTGLEKEIKSGILKTDYPEIAYFDDRNVYAVEVLTQSIQVIETAETELIVEFHAFFDGDEGEKTIHLFANIIDRGYPNNPYLVNIFYQEW